MVKTLNSYNNYNDYDLLQLLTKENDTLAFTELYNRYWKKLLIQAFSRLENETDAEEVVQDVFLNLWNRRQRLQIRNTFYTYIAASVKYEILAKLAKQKIKAEFEQKAGPYFAGFENQTTDWIDYETTRSNIEAAVQKLPEKCRIAFRLSREKGYSEKQIARELDISTKTVEAHISKALKFLRSSIQLFSLLF